MRHSYARITSEVNLKEFKNAAVVDKVHCDVISTKYDSNTGNLHRMFDELKKGDTIIIESIESAFIDVNDIVKLLELVDELELEVLDLVNNNLLSLDNGFLAKALSVVDMMQKKRKGKYPDNWVEVYELVSTKQIDRFQATVALNLGQTQLYTLLKLYTRE